jgi:DNA-binding transcriptional ArsR family regulator
LTAPHGADKVNLMVKYDTDRAFKALADPTRRDILESLMEAPASISDLARRSNISLPGIMKHVRVLEDAQLVRSEKRGRTRECSLGPRQLEDVAEWVEWYRGEWERRLDRLEAAIERKKGDAT